MTRKRWEIKDGKVVEVERISSRDKLHTKSDLLMILSLQNQVKKSFEKIAQLTRQNKTLKSSLQYYKKSGK
ncbi:MAG: hypothetical protein LBC44_00475 [Mycoplasmataceae bacterium]|nr:hypothetical protein [Mycoplasmataceae bacterium]